MYLHKGSVRFQSIVAPIVTIFVTLSVTNDIGPFATVAIKRSIRVSTKYYIWSNQSWRNHEKGTDIHHDGPAARNYLNEHHIRCTGRKGTSSKRLPTGSGNK
jgi:hypothetical protein